MFVNVNAHPGSRPMALGQLGELSRARVIPSEFKYNKGTEIFGEAEPADYVYQVADGAVRSHKLLPCSPTNYCCCCCSNSYEGA